jgi:transcriptional regulator with XRE-family HTH domain
LEYKYSIKTFNGNIDNIGDTMAKPVNRTFSRQNLEALELLAKMIRVGRIDRKMSAQEMANRAGISRPLLRRIESADPSCAIGSVFEVAAIAGVPLFGGEPDRIETQRAALTEKLSLLPQRTRKPRRVIHDDF